MSVTAENTTSHTTYAVKSITSKPKPIERERKVGLDRIGNEVMNRIVNRK